MGVHKALQADKECGKSPMELQQFTPAYDMPPKFLSQPQTSHRNLNYYINISKCIYHMDSLIQIVFQQMKTTQILLFRIFK